MKQFKIFLSSGLIFGSACTGPINSESTAAMATGFLCRLLDGSEYVTTPAEQMAVYAELEKRGDECFDRNDRLVTEAR